MKRAALLLFLFTIGCRTTMRQETGFLDRQVIVSGTAYRYAVYVPRDYDRTRQWPVVLFLHGSGERGVDGLKPTQVGVGSAIRFEAARVPAIVVFPQAPPNARWDGATADAAMAALDKSIAEFNGDRERIYLTGLSLGGYGSWHLGIAHPEQFAAIAVVCGGLLPHGEHLSVRQSPLTMHASDPYAFVAQTLRRVPIRIFHGAEDTVIPVDESRRMYAALQAAGADVAYVEYPGVGHNAWDPAYGDAKLWSWMFAQRRATAAAGNAGSAPR